MVIATFGRFHGGVVSEGGCPMKIEKIRIQNLRAFEDEEVTLDEYTALVGSNGAGKSTVLCALNIFFREVDNASTNMSELDAQDFHLHDTEKPIIITVTFKDLSETAQERFAGYARQGRLTISAEANFDPATGHAAVQQFGQRLGILAFKAFFGAEKAGEKVEVLRERYANARAAHPELPDERTKDAMRNALRAYEDAHPEACVLIPSNDQFYGFSKGANRLAEQVQWVYVPAVKDATKEQLEARNTALGRLLARKVRGAVKFDEELAKLKQDALAQYQALLDGRQATLEHLSKALQARLGEWAHPETTVSLTWDQDAGKAVSVEEPFARMVAGEGDFRGELARFGHGLQRSYLLALLQELASADEQDAPTLILGIEEPELYQHPPQARHLSGVLQKLSEANAQVIVSTHSPHFVTGAGFEAVRMVRRIPEERKSVVRQASIQQVGDDYAAATGAVVAPLDQTLARLNQALQPSLNEMFFTPRLILVEGLEDLAYLTSWMLLTDRVAEFRRRGCHIVPANGKSELIRPLIVARRLCIPTYTIFDADGDQTDPSKRARHLKDNSALLAVLGGDPTEPFPTAVVADANYTIWPTNLGGALQADVGKDRWEVLHAKASDRFGYPSGFGKNMMHIGTKLAIAREAGDEFPTLELICDRLIAFG